MFGTAAGSAPGRSAHAPVDAADELLGVGRVGRVDPGGALRPRERQQVAAWSILVEPEPVVVRDHVVGWMPGPLYGREGVRRGEAEVSELSANVDVHQRLVDAAR